MPNQAQQLTGIEKPHDHDVLSGRGNFVNYHPGNEHFRSIVRKHKVEYVACPKPQKSRFSKLIVNEIKSLDPPGRFLKQDPKTKLWYDIGEKKALDKTRQALREGAPELLKELRPSDDEASEEFTCTEKSVQNERFDLAGGVARLNVDGGLPYHNMTTHSSNPHARPDSQLSSAHSVNAHVPVSHPGRVTSAAIPAHASLNHSNQANEPVVAAATQNLNDLHQQLATSYNVNQLEPTPMNPNLTFQIQEAQAQLDALQQQIQRQQLQLQSQGTGSGGDAQGAAAAPQPELHRDDSLKFDDVFEETAQKKKEEKRSSRDGHDSSAMSGMSFSVGDMTVSEESVLSAVFEDSVRISGGPSRAGHKETDGSKKGTASSGTKPPSNKSVLDRSLMMDSFEMSTTTFAPGESQAFGNSTMQMSFTKVFEESATDFNSKNK